jgi:uncharacterized protein YgiM (DUF1202 family)
MINKASFPSMAFLWRVTAGVAVVLLIITLMLLVKLQTVPSADLTGTINNQSATVYLRNRPTITGRTIAILNPGTAVQVYRSTTSEDITWYHIRTESGSGWIPEANLNLSRP